MDTIVFLLCKATVARMGHWLFIKLKIFRKTVLLMANRLKPQTTYYLVFCCFIFMCVTFPEINVNSSKIA